MIALPLKSAVLELRARGVKQYQIARKLEMHPSALSQLLNGAIPIRENDPRVLKLAAIVGVAPEDAFEDRAA